MLAIVFLVFGALVTASMVSLQESYIDEIETYQRLTRAYLSNHAFRIAEEQANKLGMWPESLEELHKLVEWRDTPMGAYVLSDSPLNVHRKHVDYRRSASHGSLYESDQAVLVNSVYQIEGVDDALSADNNYCGPDDFSSGKSWCPNPSGTPGYSFMRSDSQAGVALFVAEQESKVRALAARVSNYFNVERDFPDTHGNSDKPLHNFVKKADGSSFNPGTEECVDSMSLNWDGIPVACDDLFSVWHVDSQSGGGGSSILTGVYAVDASRFNVPVRVYRNGDDMTIYTETPFGRYSGSAWSSTSLVRGEQRPAGTPSYIYTTLNKG